MVEVADRTLRVLTQVEYEDWNVALAHAFFRPERAGDLVYLDKDEEAFAEACFSIGVDVEDADASLANAVRRKLTWKESGRATFAEFDLMTKRWVAIRRKAVRNSKAIPPPPHIALLTLFSLAAERVGEISSTGAVESGYYSSLEELLAIPSRESGRLRASFAKSTEAYWESLNLWLEDQDGQRGMPSAYALMHRYVGLPISQALVRARERRNLKKMFEEQGFVPGMTVSHMDMYGAIDVWISSSRTSANTALRKMWASTEIKNRIVEIALAEFATWEGTESAGNAGSGLGQGANRCLLTVRDHRVSVRTEMRFGLVTSAGTAPGQICRIEGANGAERQFVLEQVGANAAGFDLRIVEVDVASAIGGEIRLTVAEDQLLRRLPKNVVIFTKDAFSAGYIESDRINAAVPSRVLVKDEPHLIAAVEKVLNDAAQPGYSRVDGGTRGIPHGWTVFTDVFLLRAPESSLVNKADLSAFQPRLSVQMSIAGGLKLPGRMPRWSALTPLQVVIASETDDPVDLVMVTRNDDTLQSEEVVIRQNLSVPAVVELDALPNGVNDFSLSLRRGKTILQNMGLKLRSSANPSPDAAQRFRNLCHDVNSPTWPIQSVPSEDASIPGMEGIWTSAPVIPVTPRRVPARPAWSGKGQMQLKSGALLIAGPPKDSCIVTGRHRFDFPTFDGKRPKSRWMYGICLQCGMSRRQPTWAPKNKKNDDVLVSTRPRNDLPRIDSSQSNWVPLVDALFYLGEGSRRDFSVLARQLEDSALFESRALHDLEALGILELERDAELEVVRWETATSCIGELADGSWILTGYWDLQSTGEVLQALEESGAELSVIAPGGPPIHRIDGLSRREIDDVAAEFEVSTVPQAGFTIAQALPDLSTVGEALQRKSMPLADSYEFFDTRTASWLSLEAAVLPGLYRISQSFSSKYYYRNRQDVETGRAAIVTVELGKHLAALDAQRPLIAFDPSTECLAVPMGADLPGIYARALTMCSGQRPAVSVADRSLNYFNVPSAVAETLIGKVTS